MINKGILKIFLLFVFSAILIFSAQSQNRKYFVITGKIINESESFEKCFVQIKKQDKDSLVFPIQLNGKFRLELDYNSQYKITFSQVGQSSKTILVNTNIPQDVMTRPTNFSNFIIGVKLSKADTDQENFYSEKLVQQIAYSPVNDEFTRIPAMFEMQYVDKGNHVSN
jgi:hypothetical protein